MNILSFSRLCIAAVLFFAVSYVHLFMPLWFEQARPVLTETVTEVQTETLTVTLPSWLRLA